MADFQHSDIARRKVPPPNRLLWIWRLDRLARSLLHLLDSADDRNRRGIAQRSLTESIDTTTPSGRFIQHFGRAGFDGTRDHCRTDP